MQSDPLWYKDAVIYETHVRAFCDSVGDGVGDFRGLASKLDYLRDLGVTAIWLLPFYPSPLRDDGYDIADYTTVHPQYGTLEAFQEFLAAAHERGLRVITELVINHTSDQHPWFQRARQAPKGSPERDFYVWSDTPDKYLDARIIFKDFESSNWSYDNVAGAYYWHRFYSHQPDLNYDNRAVWDAILPLLDYWFEMGIDGLRLDAIPYLYEREGTNCENLPETHAFLKALRAHVEKRFPDRMLLAEANQWPEDAVEYFGQGDECHMAFHFPVMPRLFMAIHREDRFPIIDIMDQTPAIPENCQWAMFLRNHDELTLEMVTDEERDHMYRAYAHDTRARINLGIRRRLAPLLGNNRRKIELMNGLLFSLPGTPVMYYGDEIGMGDNIYLGDRNGVRTPMQWSADRNAGFSRANPQKLYLPIVIDPEYHYETINVEAQQNNPNSLLWWTKRLIDLRKRHKAFSRGTLEFLHPDNRKILAFVRSYNDEHILVVANLSRFVQFVRLDLQKFSGHIPTELFGTTPFPPIGRLPYMLTLGPNSFYWFRLEPQKVAGRIETAPLAKQKPQFTASGSWETMFARQTRAIEAALPRYIRRSPWYDEWPKTIKAATVREQFRISAGESTFFVLVVDVEYGTGDTGTYAVPLAYAAGTKGRDLLEFSPDQVFCELSVEDQSGVVHDAVREPAFRGALIDLMAQAGKTRGSAGSWLSAQRTTGFEGSCQRYEEDKERPARDFAAETIPEQPRSPLGVVSEDGQVAFKFLYRLEDGEHPDWEFSRFLVAHNAELPLAPAIGAIDFRPRIAEAATAALLHCHPRHDADGWLLTIDMLGDYCERVLSLADAPAAPPEEAWPAGAGQEMPKLADDLLGDYLDHISILGRRLGELHLALASDRKLPAFAPESYAALHHRSIYQSMRTLKMGVFDELHRRREKLSPKLRELAQRVLRCDADIMACFRKFLEQKLSVQRIRCHGDFDLSNVLWTGKDFIIANFQGAPVGSSASERRLKRCAVWDVASMLRSFHYATQYALFSHGKDAPNSQALVRKADRERLQPWVEFWNRWVSYEFLTKYRQTVAGTNLLPSDDSAFQTVLDAFMLERALRELRHEFRFRSRRVGIPLAGILDILRIAPPSPAPTPAAAVEPPAEVAAASAQG